MSIYLLVYDLLDPMLLAYRCSGAEELHLGFALATEK